MIATRNECQACPYSAKRENFVVICFPCLKEVIGEMERKEEEKRKAAQRDCFCMRGGRDE